MITEKYLNVPIELIKYAHKHKIHKALGLYLLMKASCDGHLVLSCGLRTTFMGLLKIKDKRSFDKHLQRLVKENWIGHDPLNQIYFIRGTKRLRERLGLQNGTAVVFYIGKDTHRIKDFVHGAIIGYDLIRKNRARNGRIRKLAGSSALKKEGALQELAARGKISEYIGLSLSVIGKLLVVSQSQADRIKSKLVSAGYISTVARFKVVHVSDAPDFNLIKYLRSDRRYSFKRRKVRGQIVYEFRERTYDEILSLMEFRSQKGMMRRMQKKEFVKA